MSVEHQAFRSPRGRAGDHQTQVRFAQVPDVVPFARKDHHRVPGTDVARRPGNRHPAGAGDDVVDFLDHLVAMGPDRDPRRDPDVRDAEVAGARVAGARDLPRLGAVGGRIPGLVFQPDDLERRRRWRFVVHGGRQGARRISGAGRG